MEPPGCKDARKFYFQGVYLPGKLTATAVAVFGGALGCIGLLMKRKWALGLLLLSLLGIVVQDIAMFVLVNGAALAGPVAVVLQLVVLVVGVLLVLLARKGAARAWLV